MGIYHEAFNEPKRTKKYVEVIADHSEEGVVQPLCIVWDTGVRYQIDRVLDVRQAHSLKTVGTGMRYTIRIGGHDTYLWYEGPRWFVEARSAYMPE
jgi:hypothetical protein